MLFALLTLYLYISNDDDENWNSLHFSLNPFHRNVTGYPLKYINKNTLENNNPKWFRNIIVIHRHITITIIRE